MGAMNCVRKGCGSPCSRYYIDDIGYICSSCKEEFEAGFKNNLPMFAGENQKRSFIKSELQDFVKTFASDGSIQSLDEFFGEADRS